MLSISFWSKVLYNLAIFNPLADLVVLRTEFGFCLLNRRNWVLLEDLVVINTLEGFLVVNRRNGVPLAYLVGNGIIVVPRERFETIVRTCEVEVCIIGGNLEKRSVVAVVTIVVEVETFVVILEVMVVGGYAISVAIEVPIEAALVVVEAEVVVWLDTPSKAIQDNLKPPEDTDLSE